MTESLDERLIGLLSQDARQHSQVLAKQLNVSSHSIAWASRASAPLSLLAVSAFAVRYALVAGAKSARKGCVPLSSIRSSSSFRWADLPSTALRINATATSYAHVFPSVFFTLGSTSSGTS